MRYRADCSKVQTNVREAYESAFKSLGRMLSAKKKDVYSDCTAA